MTAQMLQNFIIINYILSNHHITKISRICQTLFSISTFFRSRSIEIGRNLLLLASRQPVSAPEQISDSLPKAKWLSS